jgi:hypothetical protein
MSLVGYLGAATFESSRTALLFIEVFSNIHRRLPHSIPTRFALGWSAPRRDMVSTPEKIWCQLAAVLYGDPDHDLSDYVKKILRNRRCNETPKTALGITQFSID